MAIILRRTDPMIFITIVLKESRVETQDVYTKRITHQAFLAAGQWLKKRGPEQGSNLQAV
jgi:hypothetical protein